MLPLSALIPNNSNKSDCNPCPVTGESKCKCLRPACISYPPDMKCTLRKLFTDHASYDKFIINSVLDGIGDDIYLVGRLKSNADDIGNYLSPFIGVQNGNNLSQLFREHIDGAGDTVKAVKSRNPQALELTANNLYRQGDSLALFLSNLIPNKLSYEIVKNEFRQHNQYMIELMVLRNSRRTVDEIRTYDAYYNHMLMFSDLIYYALNK